MFHLRVLFKAFILLFPALAMAQDYVDLASAYYTNTAMNQIEKSDQSTRVQEYGVSFTYPKKFKNGNALIAGVDAEAMNVSMTPAGEFSTVGSVMLKVGLNQQLGEKWSGTYVFLPKVASDFYGPLNSKDFQYGGLAIFKYAKRSDFKYKLGLYYNSELFGPFFVPVFGVYYKSPNKKLEVDLSLPINGDVNYRLNDKWFVGWRYYAIVKTYNLHRQYYQVDGQYLAKSNNETYLYLGCEVKKGLLIRGQVGYSVGRNFRLYASDDKADWGLSAFKFGDDRTQLNTDFANGVLFRLDMIFRIYTK